MKSYLALVPQYERVHRKSSRMSVLCIVFSVLLVTAIFSMADMALRAQKSYFIKTNGEYHASVTGISEETAELIGARLDVAVCGWTYQGSMGMIGSKTVSFAGASEDAFSILTEMELQSGTYPARPDEALLNQTALEQLGLSVGDTVTVALSDGRSKTYHVTGVLRDMGSLLKADVYGMVMNEDGFREIADENAIDGTTFRIQFKPGVNIRSAIREIRDTYGLSDRQVAENTALLGLMGQSENSTMQSLYIVATFLILLVLIAGTVMIAASFNTNVLERVQFYGLLRCLGADKQFSDINDDTVVAATRNLLPADSTVSDKRLSNSESQSAYYTGAIFIYGFLIIIAFITVFNIFNSMNASVASRTRQYGIMRSIGMGVDQLRRMIAAEAFTYAVLGCVAGCILGLPLNKLMFQFLIAEKWGTGWTIPVSSLLIIVLTCLASAGIAIRRPIKQISSMAIVDTIKLQQ